MRVCVFVLTAVALLGFGGQSRADKKGPPTSRKQVTTGGKYVFVMLAPRPVEEEIKNLGAEDAKNAVIARQSSVEPSISWADPHQRCATRRCVIPSDSTHCTC